MEALKEWVRGLVILIILASLLELLIPMNGMKKFVRMAMGLLIVLGVVRPIVTLLGQPVAVDPGMLVSETPGLPSMSQIMVEAGRFQQKNEELLLKEAEGRLTAEVRAAARQVEGVADVGVALKLVRDAGEGGYLVEGVILTVLPGSRYGAVRPVKPVQVQPGGAGSDAGKVDGAAGKDGGADRPATEAEIALAEAVRREVAARLGLTDPRVIQVLIER